MNPFFSDFYRFLKVSDAILDAHLAQDPRAKVACETFAKTGMIMVGGEISSKANVNYQEVIRNKIKVIFSKVEKSTWLQ